MKPRRACLECKEREAYIDFVREKGVGEITARCKNRYIDEFLRFCQEQYRHSDVSRLTAKQIDGFARHLCSISTKIETAKTKLAEVLLWLEWLNENGVLRKNPGSGLSAGSVIGPYWQESHPARV